jgi:hypothetical protein
LCHFVTRDIAGYRFGQIHAIENLDAPRRNLTITVRFDDRLVTILTLPVDGERAKAVVWSQLVSFLAQTGSAIIDDQRAPAFAHAAALQSQVPVERRKFVAESIGGRINDPATLLLFGQDVPAVAAPVMIGAQMPEASWTEIIPQLPPATRAVLRSRRDLPDAVTRMLNAYGATDTALPSRSTSDEPALDENKPIQIRDLVARIEAFKQERESSTPPTATTIAVETIATSFRFETDRAGLICWLEGAPRGALIGISLAEMAEPRSFGVDGHAAGAFRKRTSFQNARLLVAGNGAASGGWLISADPTFDTDDGRFRGYRGIARRAAPGEQADGSAISPFGGNMSSDSVRQLVHELRSPLNAIRGFAEMIDGQLLGPVSQAYRQQARYIVEDSAKLAAIIDDVDVAARLDVQDQPSPAPEVIDIADIVKAVIDLLQPQCDRFDVSLTLSIDTEYPWSRIERHGSTRLIQRLIATMVGIAEPSESLAVNVSDNIRRILITIDRPHLFDASIDLNSGDLPEEARLRCANPPALGLSFAIRLIRQMADAIGGQFRTEPDKFTLILPPAHDSEEKTKESS